MSFLELIEARFDKGLRLCAGLDPVLDRIASYFPNGNRESVYLIERFLRPIIDAIHHLVAAFKPNSAFFEAHGPQGMLLLESLINYIITHYPEVPIILDWKRGDVRASNQAYAQAFVRTKAHACTLNPYVGGQALAPFLELEGKGLFFLCKTSNPGSDEFQDLKLFEWEKRLCEKVACRVKSWQSASTRGLVVGATYSQHLAAIRKIVGQEMVLLVPGVGSQGGELEAALLAATNDEGKNFLINASRSLLYAGQPGDGSFVRASQEYVRMQNNHISQTLATLASSPANR
ncbi:orotidine-5'-phosphate decarboxylase [Candidatus Berkelbacteria bacterium]|nr:orotidine-5'-phosphate decarboxylase [Candidatus Berkelbacteria bacterium]